MVRARRDERIYRTSPGQFAPSLVRMHEQHERTASRMPTFSYQKGLEERSRQLLKCGELVIRTSVRKDQLNVLRDEEIIVKCLYTF